MAKKINFYRILVLLIRSINLNERVVRQSKAIKQHPEKDRWKRSVFLAFFQAAMENDLGCFTIRDKTAGVVMGPQDSTHMMPLSKL